MLGEISWKLMNLIEVRLMAWSFEPTLISPVWVSGFIPRYTEHLGGVLNEDDITQN